MARATPTLAIFARAGVAAVLPTLFSQSWYCPTAASRSVSAKVEAWVHCCSPEAGPAGAGWGAVGAGVGVGDCGAGRPKGGSPVEVSTGGRVIGNGSENGFGLLGGGAEELGGVGVPEELACGAGWLVPEACCGRGAAGAGEATTGEGLGEEAGTWPSGDAGSAAISTTDGSMVDRVGRGGSPPVSLCVLSHHSPAA
ncbi:MAG TPA: hypothetical protein VKP30_03520, partial [Polyangiaceae bacterium]|nr:hypothetical protein [Polyangiaceae bacterium]